MKNKSNVSDPERGGAGVKLLLVLAVVVLAANAAYQWIPVAYNSEVFKQEMQTAVVQSMALPPTAGTPADVTKKRLKSLANSLDAGPDVIIDVKAKNNAVIARVHYTKVIPLLPFGLYDYNFEFDHTATPSGFLARQ